MSELKRRVRDWAPCLLVFVALIGIISHARTAFAQSSGGAGVLTGVVIDASDKKPQADVVVTATSPALQGEQVVVTDSSGFFRIPDLPSGVYALQLEKDGYKPATRDTINLHSEATLRINVEILPTSLKAEEVVNIAKAPTIDIGSSAVGANITQDFTRRVPTAPPGRKGARRTGPSRPLRRSPPARRPIHTVRRSPERPRPRTVTSLTGCPSATQATGRSGRRSRRSSSKR